MTEFSITEITKLELQEGDILLVRVPEDINPRFVQEWIERSLRRSGLERVQVLCGPKSVDFSIIRKDAA